MPIGTQRQQVVENLVGRDGVGPEAILDPQSGDTERRKRSVVLQT